MPAKNGCCVRATGALAATVTLGAGLAPGSASALAEPLEGIHKIRHVVMIMHENRSQDTYFGTFPGANGIPAGTCVPDPVPTTCVKPLYKPG
jgi:phospholipase C